MYVTVTVVSVAWIKSSLAKSAYDVLTFDTTFAPVYEYVKFSNLLEYVSITNIKVPTATLDAVTVRVLLPDPPDVLFFPWVKTETLEVHLNFTN